jgi:hypothetical protein
MRGPQIFCLNPARDATLAKLAVADFNGDEGGRRPPYPRQGCLEGESLMATPGLFSTAKVRRFGCTIAGAFDSLRPA